MGYWHTNTRKATNLLLDAVDAGVLNPEHVLQNLLGYLPEATVAEFVSDEYSELEPEDEDTDEEDAEDEEDEDDTDEDEEAQS